MSRAYRITVRESAARIIRAGDHASCDLELLDILPPERMAGLLAQELERRGFRSAGETWVRQDQGITVKVDPCRATVTVHAEAEHEVTVEGERVGWVGIDSTKTERARATEDIRRELQRDLQGKADRQRDVLQKRVTDNLEGHLGDVRAELDRAVNRVVAEALKEKAASLGHIKEMTEDALTGSLTIVVEV